MYFSLAETCSDGVTPSIIWSSVEVSVGIICACLPTIQPVLRFVSTKVRDATSQRRTRRENSGLWYSNSIARGSRKEKRGQGGTYEASDEELATLHPVHSNTKSASEKFGVGYDAEAIDDSKGRSVKTIRAIQRITVNGRY